jgi:lysophospholipase L1-like esterase
MEPSMKMPLQILMLGDCTLATSYLPPPLKPEARLAEALARRYPGEAVTIVNEGLNGESVAGLLRRYDRTMQRHPAPDYVLIRYGVNDRKAYGVDGFRRYLRELCDRLTTDYPHARLLLETGIYVDYPKHYEYDRNARLQPINDVIRGLGAERRFPVVDVYARMQRETEQGNWDLRIRGYGIVDDHMPPVLGAGQDHLHGHDIRWFTNIHPNPAGVAVIADEEARVFAAHWPDGLRSSQLARGSQQSAFG